MKIVEICNNWPAETFIQRHKSALEVIGSPVQLIARHSLTSSNKASLGVDNAHELVQIMPNFNHLSRRGKIASLRFLNANSLRFQDVNTLADKVLLGYFERLSPELIHFHDATLAAGMHWIPNKLGIPYTTSLRGSDIQVFPLQLPAHRNAILAVLEEAAGVHAVCDALGQRAAQLLGNDLTYSVIYTTVPIPDALPPCKTILMGESIHFVSSGRLMWRKGFDNLLVALRQVRDMGLNARLTLIGVGPDLDYLLYLRNLIGLDHMVTFPGKLSYQQILELFRGADVYIQSSIAEGLSNSLAEAMANGLPIFATDVGGTREVIEDGVSGFLLPALAPQDWAETLMLVQNVTLMEKVRVASYDKARRLFSAKQHAESFKTFFRNVPLMAIF